MMKKKEKIVIAGIWFLVVLEVLKYGIATKVIVGGFFSVSSVQISEKEKLDISSQLCLLRNG